MQPMAVKVQFPILNGAHPELARTARNAPALAPPAPPAPAKPASKPESRVPGARRETDTPMKPFERPAHPDERPCTRPDPDTGFPTCNR